MKESSMYIVYTYTIVQIEIVNSELIDTFGKYK